MACLAQDGSAKQLSRDLRSQGSGGTGAGGGDEDTPRPQNGPQDEEEDDRMERVLDSLLASLPEGVRLVLFDACLLSPGCRALCAHVYLIWRHHRLGFVIMPELVSF